MPTRIAPVISAWLPEPTCSRISRLGEPELLVEDRSQLAVVVLAGVERDQLDAAGERGVQRRRLDELRAGFR